MPDWTKPFESSWRWVRVSRSTGYETEQLGNLTTGSLSINSNTTVFESASVDCIGMLDVGHDFVRCYLEARWDDGTTESVCMGTWLANVPSRDVYGSYEECTVRLDGRLIELDEDSFENIVTVAKGQDPVAYAKSVCEASGLTVLQLDSYSGTLGSTWRFGLEGMSMDEDYIGSKLKAVNSLLREAAFRSAETDAYGNVLFRKRIDYDSPPVWAFKEGLNATFLSAATDERDVTEIANKVITVYETEEATTIGIATDTDPASPWSTVSLGRVRCKVYNYDTTATQAKANDRAARLLDEQQSVTRRVTISHVYCPVRVGDIVSIDYPSARISGKFAIRTQEIELGGAGCLTKSELRRFERA